jgi:hypothetical protein
MRVQDRGEQLTVSAADVHDPIDGREVARMRDLAGDELRDLDHRAVEQRGRLRIVREVGVALSAGGELARALAGLHAVVEAAPGAPLAPRGVHRPRADRGPRIASQERTHRRDLE